jgi:Asp-tRNA(Asn)/Glu-tRNA(Gln) amidotransferase A subunit family amidase
MRHESPEDRPPLYGLLVGVKDIFRADGFPTYAGSQLPPELFDGPETACVTRVKQVGGLILGKTVTTEFAYFQPGPTRNPHNLKHTPGGSSSGSAAAVAAGYCGLAFGTQTIGSVIRPAAFCGVVGFKPSFDRIPTDGLLYLSPSMDHIGLFTQDVAGMRLAASQICQDWREEQALAPDSRQPVLGVPDGPYLTQASPEGLAAFEAQILHLQAAGVTVRRIPALANIEAVNQRHRRIVAAEAARVHHAWFAQYADRYSQAMTTLIKTGQQISDDQLAADLEESQEFRREIQAQMDREGIDLWVCPSATGPAPQGIESTGDPIMNLPWTHAGVPVIGLPAGRAQNGLPLGLQFVGRFLHDEQLLAWAETLAEHL